MVLFGPALPSKREVPSLGLYVSGESNTLETCFPLRRGVSFYGRGASLVGPFVRTTDFGRNEFRRRGTSHKHKPHETMKYNAIRHSEYYARRVASYARIVSLGKEGFGSPRLFGATKGICSVPGGESIPALRARGAPLRRRRSAKDKSERMALRMSKYTDPLTLSIGWSVRHPMSPIDLAGSGICESAYIYWISKEELV